MPQGFFVDHSSAEEMSNSSTTFWVKIREHFAKNPGCNLVWFGPD